MFNRTSTRWVVTMLMSEAGLSEAPAVLPGARFSDTFTAVTDERIDASVAVERAFMTSPGWVDKLMGLRDRIVRPFGLKTRNRMNGSACKDKQILFRVLERSSDRVILGTDDKHLDFRLILRANPTESGGTHVSCTTLVRPHNMLGWLYLGSVLPFHKLIMAAFMHRIVV